jgi:hypothetical protein
MAVPGAKLALPKTSLEVAFPPILVGESWTDRPSVEPISNQKLVRIGSRSFALVRLSSANILKIIKIVIQEGRL